MKKALITGITGQDGSYLADLLLSKGYVVHGMIRRASSFNTSRLDHIRTAESEIANRLHLYYGDLSDASCITNLVYDIQPDEIYHLGAQSHVRVSFSMPEYTADIVALGTTRMLEAIRVCGLKKVRYYQASSSEMYGNSEELPQNETTPLLPRSPYATAKVYAHQMVTNYREGYNLHATNGILFNHESPRRTETFVTRKITKAAARIKLGLQDKLLMGNIKALRDWGYAPEYVHAMWLMLQQEDPDDYVIATNEAHTVEEFLDECFGMLDLDWHDYVEHSDQYERPTDVGILRGDASKAEKKLGWAPKVRFRELAKLMLENDMQQAEREKRLAEDAKLKV